MKRIISLLLLSGFLAAINTSCKKKESYSNINVEQKHNPEAHNILTPGMGTIGIIHDSVINVYFLNEHRVWILDKVSSFIIPKGNEGIIGVGLGHIGVIKDGIMNFYRLDARNLWVKEKDLLFVMPQQYDRIMVVNYPWEIGVIGIEADNQVEFFYLDGNIWRKDETATFQVPDNIDDYFSIGSMNIAVVQDNFVSFFSLTESEGWKYHENYFLRLPAKHDALISYEQNVVGVLADGVIRFHEVEFFDPLWILDESMNFHVPKH